VVEPSSDGAVELDASGCIVTPGLVNAHHHLLQTAFRTLPGTRGVPMRDWLPRMASA
jgi:8-oxoguanine deaminase